jgi:hypothetical protein
MRAFTKFLGVTALAWIVATLGAELAFRASGDQPTFDLHGMYAPFEDGTYRLAANVDTEANWSSGRLTVHTDSLGLRCDADRRLAVKPNDAIDVLLLGDSQGFGNGVSFEESLSGSFALAADADGLRVANAAVGGHSAATQLLLAQRLHDRQGVKVAHYVLLVTPAMAQSGGHLSRARVGSDGRLYGSSTSRLALARTWAKTNLVIYARIRDALHNSGIAGKANNEAPFVFKFYEGGAAEESLRRSFSDYIARFKEFAAKAGAQLHVVYLPLTLEMEFEPIRTAAAARGLTIDPDVPLRATAAAARVHQVTFHSLRSVLKSLHDQGKPLHLKGDFHYDRELSVACGRDLWAALKSRLSPSPSTQPKKERTSHGE